MAAGPDPRRTSSELEYGGEGGAAQEEEEETDSIATKLSQVFLSVFLLSCLETKMSWAKLWMEGIENSSL